MTHFDLLEIREPEERLAEQYEELRRILDFALGHAPGVARQVGDTDPDGLTGPAALARLPILRKSDLAALQAADPPFGGLATRRPGHFKNLFLSPGPILEPGGDSRDWWRLGRFLHAATLTMGDIIQNCFSYHLTPAGLMFESAVAAISATCVPAGTGNTEQQVEVARRLGVTAYAGTPDYLKVILDKADEMGVTLTITKAAVGGGALFPSLRAEYAARGIHCRQCYATADLGLIAYETESTEGMVIDEGVIVEIVRPGTGDPVPPGEVGEVVVTALNPDYPLLRFATGDLSAILPGESSCGRTGPRLRGWLGRADQTTKVKGMFVRPEQVAALVARHPGVTRARIVVTREGEQDAMQVEVEAGGPQDGLTEAMAASVEAVLKLKGRVQLCAPGSLPNDGKVIDDRRTYAG